MTGRRSSKKKPKKRKSAKVRSEASAPESAREDSAPVKNQEAVAEHSSTSTAKTTAGKQYGSKEALFDFTKGLIFIALVFSIKLMIEHTTFGKQLELMSYNLLQLQLGSHSLPITIVDISELKPEEFNIDGQTGLATPRESLKEMMEAIAAHSPRAIGVDIDFSPDENAYIDPRDPQFFQFCLELGERKGIPVILGVKRTIHKPSSEWLHDDKYQSLAGSILVPKDSRRMLRLIKLEDETKAGGTGTESRAGKSMAVALADAYAHTSDDSSQPAPDPFVIGSLEKLGIIEKFSERRPVPGLSLEDFLVDFSSLESIESISTTDPAKLRDPNERTRFQGKIVLLGDATLGEAADTFIVPGRDQPVPGVLVHASAAYTLLREPLYEVTHRGRLIIDLLLSGTILIILVLIRLYHRNEKPHSFIQGWQGFLTVAVVVAAVVGGVFFVRSTRVMWDDFFLALTMLIFHPSIERHVEGMWAWTMKYLKRRSRPVSGEPKD